MAIYRASLTFLKLSNGPNLSLSRCVRNLARRGGGPKLLEGTVKRNNEFEGEDFQRITSYDDVMKIAGPEDRILVEKALTSENDFGAALGEQNAADLSFHDNRSLIKKKIIERKHFKMDKAETNLMTCAAKEQVRHLHQLNPNEWTLEALSEHFPITVNGLKKLLKSYFVHKDPDKIKQHDAEVEEKWRALESGQPSKLITPYTRRLWMEGKLNKLNYKSNPNLPSALPDDGKTVILKKPRIGEFGAIVQQYVNYKAKLEGKVEPSDGKEVVLNKMGKSKAKHNRGNNFKFSDYRYRTEDEIRIPDLKKNRYREKLTKRVESFDDLDVVHSQYTTDMKEVRSPKEITSNPQYAEWMNKQSKQREPQTVRKTPTPEVFVKIPKFKESDNFQYNTVGNEEIAPDQKPGFHTRRDKTRDSNRSSVSSKKRSIYRDNHNVYDEHGQFLYKVPFKG